MSSETQEPPLGTPNPDASAPEPDVSSQPAEPAPVAPQPYYSGSGDDLSLSLSALLAHAKPDPLLGEFQPAEPPPVADAVVPHSSSEDLSALDIEKPLPLQPDQPAGSFDAITPLPPTPPAEAVCEPALPAEAVCAAPPELPTEEHPSEPAAAGSLDAVATPVQTEIPPEPVTEVPPESVTEAPPIAVPEPEPAAPESPFAGLDLSAPPSAKAAPAKKEEEEDDDDDYEDEPQGSSWPFVLLASYASAVTIGLIWVLWGHRLAKTTEEDDPFPPANTSADPGSRAGNSRKVTPPPPIAAEHLTTLGKPVTLGGVEVTPIEVTSGPVELQRVFNAKERQKEGGNALKLHLKIRNLTKDAEFDPCDEAFLREREAGVADSFIETGDGKTIEMYPLAVRSEWAIVGQDFKTLKPGETLDTLIVSNKEGFEQKAPEMTWRVRLRTGVEQTGSFGVRFKDSDIKPGR